VFERFTERARQVVVLAQDEARALKHNYIGTEHILLGLLREDEGLAARVLESLDITVEEVRAQVARIVGQGDEVTTGQIPFTPEAKKTLELALREALSLGHNYIGTEHLLLGLMRENEGVAVRILLDFDVDAEKVRNEVIRLLSGPSRRTADEEPAPSPWLPPSPPFSPELAAELEKLRKDKEAAIERHGFEEAASLRDRERRLVREAKQFERTWSLRGAAPSPPSRPTPRSGGLEPARGRMPRRVTDYGGLDRPLGLLLLGWALFGLAAGLGLLVGRLIWG
jgi:hypothetical protein